MTGPQLVWRESADGQPVPGALSDGRFRPLHSLRRPGRESERVESAHSECDLLIMAGAGALYQLPGPREGRSILLLVPDGELFRESLVRRGLAAELAPDGRKDLLIREVPLDGESELMSLISAIYRPFFHRRIALHSLTSLEQLYPGRFNAFSAAVARTVRDIQGDYLTQAHLGIQWQRNILINRLQPDIPPEPGSGSSPGFRMPYYADAGRMALARLLCRAADIRGLTSPDEMVTAVVLGAGPGLEASMGKIAELRRTAPVIASDTALPLLAEKNIQADICISIDPQQYSLRHFTGMAAGSLRGSTLLCDSGSPPALLRLCGDRLGADIMMLPGPHPLERYLRQDTEAETTEEPPIAHAGNSGSQAAVIAAELGVKRIICFGLDFGSPGGRAYSRGSYQYRWSAERSDRLSPAEGYHWNLASSAPETSLDPQTLTYRNPRFISYEREFRKLLEAQGGRVSRSSAGWIVDFGGSPRRKPERPAAESSSVPDFSSGYRLFRELFALDRGDIIKLTELSQIKNIDNYRDPRGFALLPWLSAVFSRREKIDIEEVETVIRYAREKMSHIMKI